jgi:hypothetical protein
VNAGISAQESIAGGELSRPDETLDRACQLLLANGRALTVHELARQLGHHPATVTQTIEQFERIGRIRRDSNGQIVASAGVSVVPADYEILVGPVQCWAWCAKTGLGVLGALAAGGKLSTRCRVSGDQLIVTFSHDQPDPSHYGVLWPSAELQNSCTSAADQLCATFSLFASAQAASEWARAGNLDAEVITVQEATHRSTARYRHSLGLPARRDELLGYPR